MFITSELRETVLVLLFVGVVLQTDRRNSGLKLAGSQGHSGELAPIDFWLMVKASLVV